MSTPIVKSGFQVEGSDRLFDSKAEAQDFLRRPLKTAALNKLNGDNAEVTAWMLENEEAIETTFESTKIQRVTKSEKAQLVKALEEVCKAHATVAEDGTVSNIEKKFEFLIKNKEAVADSFRWPSVKRGTEEEQAATIKTGFMALTGDNVELVDWMIANKTGILEAFQAGVVKREVNEKAANALAAYRAQKAAEKAAKEAAAAK